MRDEPSPLLVEFVGAPGAGKTTISRCLVATLAREFPVAQPTYTINEELVTPHRQIAKLPYILRAAIESPAIPLRYAATAGAKLRPSLLFNWLYAMGAAHRAAHRDMITVFDQGQVQIFWSFVVSEPRDVVTFSRRALFETFPEVTSILVFVKASREVVSSRLSERVPKQSRIGSSESSTITVDDALKADEYVHDMVKRFAETRPGITLIEVKNNDLHDLASCTARVIDAIHENYSVDQRESTDS